MSLRLHNTVICLLGPTASGKTDLAIELFNKGPFDIISVDSAMVYRGMDIGTAKPDPILLQRVPHQLIDICEPTEAYSAAQFRTDAQLAIKRSFTLKRIPLLVGGTMLYFKALQQGLSPLPVADPEIRAQLSAEAEQLGWASLYAKLQRIDPLSAARIHPNDPQRIQRALEVYLITGKTMSFLLTEHPQQPLPYQTINLILAPAERSRLKERITHRFSEMLTKGLIHEVEQLRSKYSALTADMPAMRSVGYRQVWQYLDGEISYQEMQKQGVYATEQLAKRQFTWLRAWQNAHWFDNAEKGLVAKVLQFLSHNG